MINLAEYDLYKVDNVKIIKDNINKTFYDIEVENDNSFYIYHENLMILSHNCDGYHIKGLIINLFDTFWSELLEMDFIYEFVSPIVKIEKNKKKKFFYKISDYKKWKTLNEKGYDITYYKGLGTIEPDEIKSFFKDLDKHLIRFNIDNFENTKKIVDLAFNKKKADDRKDWLLQYKPKEIDKFTTKTTYESFFNHEFIEFSMADNIRSIPSIMDGFKPSQRKILYTLLKQKLSKTKVSQLSGAVTQYAAYHQGGVSLEGAIIGMAQNFVGSNNITLLENLGAFGTRLKGGKDSASSRYIFTKLSDITEYIYRKDDEDILEYLNDDGFSIEPNFYIPIIPMSLINNNSGIGTGWSSDIPQYNIIDVMKYLGCKLKDAKTIELKPHYNKFKGEIIFEPENKRYVTRGIIKKLNPSTVKISELPIGMWNDSYYEFLDKLENDKIIKDYIKNDTDEIVDITINIDREQLKQIEESNNYYKVFGLETYISINNMHLFNHNGNIKKYESVYEILDEFYEIRLKYYQKRKDYLISKLTQDKLVLLNKMKFINLILKGDIKINNVKKADIEEKLVEFDLMKVDDSYGYLLNMSIVSLTAEKLIEFSETFKRKKEEIPVLEETSIKQIWMNDLAELFKKLKK